MSVAAIIPARFASTRFPGKPLADICGKPMIQHVYERVSRSTSVTRVIVATDDERISSAVTGFGGEVMMTRADHPTGTDRLAEVAAQLDAAIIVNVQGDEPLIEPRMIDLATAPLLADDTIPMGTLKTAILDEEEFTNPNVVKVVTDRDGFALYFSRAAIPFQRDAAVDTASKIALTRGFKHIGLYVYRRDFLLKFPTLLATPLEQLEKLEQLRALENGFRIRVVETRDASWGVDVPEDLARVRKILGAA
ncbi:MAG: 3-deoxy-manno-octulosonate cytidylyltransferase [Desulfuromonadaceae bacterium]|nr:3-deoxy-manno-octulosonate cytidylyltransferase [Desulfuromonadaceae bacterium]